MKSKKCSWKCLERWFSLPILAHLLRKLLIKKTNSGNKIIQGDTISIRLQSECGKIRTRKTPNTDTFLAVIFYYFLLVIRSRCFKIQNPKSLFKTISEKKLFNLVLKLNKNDDDEWWIVFVVWLTDKRRLVLFPAGTIARDPHRRESPTRRKQDFSCAEPELRISWIKLCSSDSDYTTAPIMTGALVVLENTCSKIRSVRKKNIIGIKCVSSEMVALMQSRN